MKQLTHNIKQVVFMPLSRAQTWSPTGASALVSIHGTRQTPLEPQPGWRDVLWLCFDDIDQVHLDDNDIDQVRDRFKLFDESHAQQLLDFVERNADCETLAVNCFAGVSRSAAVALFISEWLQVPCYRDEMPVDALSWKLYNRHVYSTMRKVLYGPVESAFEAS